MAFYSSCIWLWGSPRGVSHWSSSLFLLQKRENHNHTKPSSSGIYRIGPCDSDFTSPLKAWMSWPRVNIPWQPWSPAPCSHHWWSFRLHASCWTLHPACPFQIWVYTGTRCKHCPFRVSGPTTWKPAIRTLMFDLQCGVHQKIIYSSSSDKWRHRVAVIVSWLVHFLLLCQG